VLELQGRADFTPPEPITTFLDGRKQSVVNVRFGNLAGGPIKVSTVEKGKYRVRRQPVPLAHPLFARAAEAVPGLIPSLILNVENNKLTGSVGLAAGEKVENLAAHLKAAPILFGLVGFDITALPSVSSSLEGGSLHISVKNIRIRLGSAFDGTANFEVIDGTVNFDGSAAINVKGLVQGTLELKRAADGLVTGKVKLSLNLPKNFSGEVEAAWDGTSVTGHGKVGYQGEKLSGSVTLYMMERGQAEQMEKSRQAPEGAPAPAAPAGKSKPSRVDYVVFGEGDLKYAFNDWLNGSAHVIVNPKGFVRVIGKITPQKEFTLFPQKDYVKHIFKVEARATYGVPLLADIFIFANVGLDAFANLGPATFNNIVVEGDYSTDPAEANQFTVSGHLNISAGAGLLLRGEAGAGLEILGHDIKAGAGVNATAGVKGYVDAKPNMGYREVVAAGQDKKGEFFVGGDIEIAAQAFFGLSGDLFVQLDTPWWSPLSDKTWTWPLFGKEWPLGGSLGVGAAVDYVFGSGQWPKFDFKPVEFSGEKFMTGLYDGKAEAGSGKTAEQKGKWKEKVSAAAQLPPKTSPQGNAKPGKPPPATPAKSKVARGGGKKDGKPVNPNARTKDGKTVKQHQDEAARKGKKPPGGGKDKDKSGRDGVVKESFDLGPEHHTITARIHGGVVEITMASDADLVLSAQLSHAITEVQNDKHREKTQIRAIVSDLSAAKTQVDGIRKEYEDAGRPEAFDKFLRPRLAKIIGILVRLVRYDPPITSLQHIISVGKPRYLPIGYDTRGQLYDRATKGKWTELSKSMRRAYVSKISAKLYKIWKLRDDRSNPSNYDTAEAQWNAVLAAKEIEVKKAPTFKSYEHPKHFPMFEYATDHKKSLGNFWNAGEKNADDATRSDTTLDAHNTGNLRVLTKEENSAKAKTDAKFDKDVGPNFSSAVAYSPKGSKTIDGQPFRDKE
jgi:hypothetical protein